MDIMQAKETVIRAGHELIAAGLIARTWGNISCRISDTQFVITPSGRAYDTLTPEEIVLVNIEDLEYEGEIKPSSEKGIHAACYKLRPEVNFVIHTHQVNASIVSALGMDINNVEGENAQVVGTNLPIASYGLPGTKKLRKGVIDAITRSDAKAAVMAHHGAVCMGVDYDDAFNVAQKVEDICEQYVMDKYTSLTGKVAENLTAINDYVVEKFTKKPSTAPEFPACKSERDGSVFNISVIDGDGAITRIDIETGDIIAGDANNESIELHRAVYKKRADVNFISHSKDPYTVACSKMGKTMRPLIDDFAQIVGVTVKSAKYDPNNSLATSKKVVKKLKGRNAVLLENNGALCVAGSEYDAGAIEFITNKGAKIQISAQMFEKVEPINPLETRIMRLVYKLKYSKQAGK
ncbi:MAG: class II aldolase/adducin family protein [Ruminococcaceae bacterium]|nr:class II aldolase/adducin family protein [Oscillospiraceae bacterium]